jgi:hypothetical protein
MDEVTGGEMAYWAGWALYMVGLVAVCRRADSRWEAETLAFGGTLLSPLWPACCLMALVHWLVVVGRADD